MAIVLPEYPAVRAEGAQPPRGDGRADPRGGGRRDSDAGQGAPLGGHGGPVLQRRGTLGDARRGAHAGLPLAQTAEHRAAERRVERGDPAHRGRDRTGGKHRNRLCHEGRRTIRHEQRHAAKRGAGHRAAQGRPGGVGKRLRGGDRHGRAWNHSQRGERG